MGHPIINKGDRGITMKDIQFSSYKRLNALAQTISTKMGAAVATFATPTPALATLDTAQAALQTAMIPMGQKRNRASKIQTTQAQKAANDVRNLLLQLMSYAVNTVLDLFPEDSYSFNATLATAGFSIKNKRKPKHPGQPTFVSQTVSKAFPASMMRINWRRPRGLIKGAPIAGYLIKSVTRTAHIRTAGYDDVLFTPSFGQSDPTGLNMSVTYKFYITVDGGARTLISFSGSLAQKYSQLCSVIDASLNTLGIGARCAPLDPAINDFIRIVSHTTGLNSSVLIEEYTTVPGDNLWANVTGFDVIDAPVPGTDVTVPSVFGVIGSTTKTNFILNPTSERADNITGQIVPFSARGEGNPISFTAQYII